MDRRQTTARALLIALMVLVLAASVITAILKRTEERRLEEAAREEELTRQAERLRQLVSWITEMRLKYGIEEEPPQLPGGVEEEEEDESMFEGGDKLAETETLQGENTTNPGFTAAGSAYFDWQEIVAGCQAPGWRFTDNPNEYMAYAMKESLQKGDASGRASHLWKTGEARYYGEQVYPMSEGYRVAADIFYAAWKWERWLELRGATQSEYYGQGIKAVSYLLSRGRSWENCLATLECESTYGMGGPLDYGILYGNYPNTLEGYCDLLDDGKISNDPWEQACFWNMPGYPRYQEGFTRIVETIKGWRP